MSASNDITQRPWYFSEIFCDPQDENTIYTCNLELMKSIDGGQNFKSIPQEHGDCHDLWINPDNPDNYICGYDGSAVITFTDGLTWTDMKIPTAQFYHVNLDDDFPVNAYGGQQDWGSVRIATRSYGGSIGDRDWRYVAGGEAGYIVPKPGNSNITFGGEYNGIMSTLNTDNEQETFVSVYPYINDGWGADTWKFRFAWTYPIVFSPWNGDVLYCTSNHVHRSTNGGASWETISHDLTRDDPQKQLQSGGVLTPDNTGAEVYCTIYAFAESTVQQGLLWAGSDDGLVHVSKDNGKTWLNVTPTSLPEWSTVNIIEPSRFEAGVCYLAAHRYRLGDTRPLLYKTTDFGQTWQQITDGLPANVYTRCIREDNVRKGLLYCGTETGVYFSINDGVRWYSLSNNLPVTPVWDLRVNTVDNALVIATHGRSMWVLDDIGPLRELQPELSRKDVHFFQPTPAWRMDGYQISENRLRSMRLKEGTNAPSGALFYYYLRQPANDELRMVIYNARGDSIIGFSDRVDPYGEPFDEDGEKFYSGKGTASAQLTNKSGMHRFVWDLRYPDAKSPSENFWAEDQLRGPLALPGTYKARLFKGKEMIGERTFEIRLNPEVPTSDEDLLAQFDLCLQLNRKQDEISTKIRQLKAVRQQTEGFMSGFSDTTLMPELQKIHRTLMDSLDAIEGELYNPEIETYLDPLRYPYELFEKYGSLSDFIHAGDNRPTQQMVEVFDELNKECARLYQRIDQVYATLVPQFNTMVDQMKLNVVDPQRAVPKEK
ncbi:MAG: hypothetical protein JNM00_03920 [Flavobacteriales bacterium]|nr:hypothetical protein [Flavobacteriales bacterium]